MKILLFRKGKERIWENYYWQFIIIHNMYVFITNTSSMSERKIYHSPEQFRADHPKEYARQQREGNRSIVRASTLIAAGVLSITLATSEKAQDILMKTLDLVAEQVKNAPRITPYN
jgi:hypothetical protein